MPKLSILICTLDNRKHFYDRLINILRRQLYMENLCGQVEILSECDNGEISIGQKRNKLLEKSSGLYICFIDDDDLVSDDYVKSILNSIDKNNPDVIGIHLLMTTNGDNEERTYHSIKYKTWYHEVDPDRPGKLRYFRNPNHLNPVKREYAIQVRFPNTNNGEDRVYSQNLLKFLKTEEYIEHPIYFYEYRSVK